MSTQLPDDVSLAVTILAPSSPGADLASHDDDNVKTPRTTSCQTSNQYANCYTDSLQTLPVDKVESNRHHASSDEEGHIRPQSINSVGSREAARKHEADSSPDLPGSRTKRLRASSEAPGSIPHPSGEQYDSAAPGVDSVAKSKSQLSSRSRPSASVIGSFNSPSTAPKKKAHISQEQLRAALDADRPPEEMRRQHVQGGGWVGRSHRPRDESAKSMYTIRPEQGLDFSLPRSEISARYNVTHNHFSLGLPGAVDDPSTHVGKAIRSKTTDDEGTYALLVPIRGKLELQPGADIVVRQPRRGKKKNEAKQDFACPKCWKPLGSPQALDYHTNNKKKQCEERPCPFECKNDNCPGQFAEVEKLDAHAKVCAFSKSAPIQDDMALSGGA